MLENLFNSFPLLGILADSFPKILIPGLTVTIPLTAIAFSCAMLIAVAAAIVQFAWVPVANYFIIGMQQLGTEMFQVEGGEVTLQLPEDALRGSGRITISPSSWAGSALTAPSAPMT